MASVADMFCGWEKKRRERWRRPGGGVGVGNGGTAGMKGWRAPGAGHCSGMAGTMVVCWAGEALTPIANAMVVRAY